MNLREQLLEKYNATGKIGFSRPKSLEEALSIIETLCEAYDEPKEEFAVYNLSDITNKLRSFFNEDFN